MIRLIVISCLIFFAALSLKAQKQPALRYRNLTILSDSTRIDTLTIIAGTIQVKLGDSILTENQHYTVDYNKAFLIWKSEKPATVQISYKVILFSFNKAFRHKDPSLMEPSLLGMNNPFLYTPESRGDNPFKTEGLQMNGNFSRGIAFGNSQDLVVNSNLNLQLSGKLGNEIDILAAISDENNPIQPEGNTQQLQDFDKVYIQFSKDVTRLTVGDFEMTRPDGSYFMNYYKKSRGAQFNSQTRLGNGRLVYQTDAALSRGRFSRNLINGVEGNQGPYRLTGANGELFIIIISGTEAVYLDGQRMLRGEQNDYIIDYNTGEITFTPARLITQYSRIVVEFQYSDRNYARTVFHQNIHYETEKVKIRFNYFTEQDNKNQPFQQELSDEEKRTLSDAGDQLERAVVPNIKEQQGFIQDRILYYRTDSSGFQNIYVFTNEAVPGIDTYYELGFSYVGEGLGNYREASTQFNGRVYEWLAPDNGVLQGSYEPVVQLVSPKRLEMYTAGVDFKLSERTAVGFELVQSNNNKNLFSELDKQDDAGYGFRTYVRNQVPVQKKENPILVTSDVNYEFVTEDFRYVERYRPVEFERTWNRQLYNNPSVDTGFQESIGTVRTGIGKAGIFNTSYQLGFYNKAVGFAGIQHAVNSFLNYKRFRVNADAEWVDSKTAPTLSSPGLTNEFRRKRAGLGREIAFIVAGVNYETEKSTFIKTSDLLEAGSFSFDQIQYYIQSLDTASYYYKIDYTVRTDYLPKTSEFNTSTIGKNINLTTSFTGKNSNRFQSLITYRELEIKDTLLTNLKPDRSLLARVEYDYSFIKRVFTANTYYQLGTGLELKRDFTYLQVAPGLGVYAWNDYNSNGKQELNEFEIPAQRDLARFIRVFLPTNTSVKTNTNQFNQTLNINPSTVWNKEKGVKGILSRFSNLTALRIDRKTLDLDELDFFNPFLLNVQDSFLISINSFIRNTLFFNRSDPKFGTELNYQDNRGKSLSTNGFESRTRTEKGLGIRWNITPKLTLRNDFNKGEKSSTSEFFADRTYFLDYTEIKPEFIIQFSRNFRTTLFFNQNNSKNRIAAKEKGNTSEAGTEIRYNFTNKGVLSARISYLEIIFAGNPNSPVGYEVLQGFLPGSNKQWNLNFQRRLSNNVQVNLNYDGRQASGQKAVHIGRLEARYLF